MKLGYIHNIDGSSIIQCEATCSGDRWNHRPIPLLNKIPANAGYERTILRDTYFCLGSDSYRPGKEGPKVKSNPKSDPAAHRSYFYEYVYHGRTTPLQNFKKTQQIFLASKNPLSEMLVILYLLDAARTFYRRFEATNSSSWLSLP